MHLSIQRSAFLHTFEAMRTAIAMTYHLNMMLYADDFVT